MLDEREWQTRKQRIDTKLRALNPAWKIVKHQDSLDTSQLDRHAVEEYPTANGPADYALFVKGQLLGIIEAKKVTVSPQNVLEQAKRYARGATIGPGQWDDLRVPFLYASNGEVIHFLDVRDNPRISRKISNFHTPEAMAELFRRDKFGALTWLANTPNNISRLYPFQRDAISATESAILKGKREMLLAMATGTGKTFTTVSQVYRLLESKLAQRILFLVDRRALAAQAVRAFASFATPKGNKFNQEYEVYHQRFQREDLEDEQDFNPNVLPEKYLVAPNVTHTFVYVSTIQRLTVNLLGWQHALAQGDGDPEYEAETGKIDIPIHAFDVIIADECHRGYTALETSTWRTVLNHFDAIKIGLTATPAQHTLALFREVVFRYGVDRAIHEGFLVDYDPIKLSSNVRLHGAFLKEGEQVGIIDTETGEEIYDELEDERAFAAEDIEKQITAPESNRKIIEEIAKRAYTHEQETGRFPKILIFAANDLRHTSHADQLVKICREVFNQDDDFVQKITGNPNVDRPLDKIRKFRNRPEPKIVVTVDMLTTGVDIPSLEFLVFLRPVKSRILWEQMLGRGTRLCPEINKSHFKVFDCFDGTLFEYFRKVSGFDMEAPRKEALPLQQVIENIYQNVDRDYYTKSLVKRLRRIEKDMSGEARNEFARYIPEGDIGKFAGALPDMIKQDFTPTMQLLRNENFQACLLNYKRAKRSFLIGYEVTDEVSSEVMMRAGSGYQKPEDYLEAFGRFVKENPEQIEAIRVLLERPKEWKTEVLNELREKLQRNFPEPELRKAHQLVYKKSLVDLISMIKHAAHEQEPILSATERVKRAMQKVTAGKSFNDEQQKWLGLIQEHLIENLTIELNDFAQFPIFERAGGLGKARIVFLNQLDSLVQDINYAMAA